MRCRSLRYGGLCTPRWRQSGWCYEHDRSYAQPDSRPAASPRRAQSADVRSEGTLMFHEQQSSSFPLAREHLVRLNSYLQRIYMFHRHPTSRDSTSAKHLRSTPTKRPSAELRSPRHYVLTKRLPTKLPHCETTSLRNYLPTKLPPYKTTQGMLYFRLRPQILRQDQALPSNGMYLAAEQASGARRCSRSTTPPSRSPSHQNGRRTRAP